MKANLIWTLVLAGFCSTIAQGGNQPKKKPEEIVREVVLVWIGDGLRSQGFSRNTEALADLAALLPGPAPEGVDFGPFIEPLFDKAGWGGIARPNATLAETLLVRIGLPAKDLLIEKLDSRESRERRVAIELLIRIGPANAELVYHIQPGLKDRDYFVRQAAIQGVATAGPLAKGAIEELASIATDSEYPNHQVGARLALIRIAGASLERILALAALLELPDDSATASAASALGELERDSLPAEPQLRAALAHSAGQVRGSAAGALGLIGANEPETIAALIAMLANDKEHEGCRRSAASALGRIGPKASAAIPALAKALALGEQQWWVAVEALVAIGGVDSVAPLIDTLSAEHVYLRRSAIRGLEKLGPVAVSAVPALEQLSHADPDAQNREAAEKAIQTIGGL